MTADRVAEVFEQADLLAEHTRQGRPAYEFFRRASMNMLIYKLPPGEPDRQQPHTEDEVYYVLEGEGAFEVDGERMPVQTGSVIFVEKNAAHRFVDYPNGITLLVVFAPARGTNA
ncbi:MAG: cupin domain-containing protein [Dehalococcoidia bacterium]